MSMYFFYSHSFIKTGLEINTVQTGEQKKKVEEERVEQQQT